MFSIPFEPEILSIKLNVHLILEYIAFFAAYRYYVHLRRQKGDPITDVNRLAIILGAALGALIGSRVIGFLENPNITVNSTTLWNLYNTKTIIGGLFGGLLGVEVAKKIVGERSSSGDLFTLPIVMGIAIGRVGCFLAGTTEFTYGKETTSITGMNLGDGVIRHPLALYEIAYLLVLYLILARIYHGAKLKAGRLFQIFMLSYFGFRFLVEFIKPNVFFWHGLSTIQWVCVACFVYYSRSIFLMLRAN